MSASPPLPWGGSNPNNQVVKGLRVKSSKFFLAAGVFFVMVLSAACVPISAPAGGAEDAAPAAANPVLEGTNWQLTELAAAVGTLAPVPAGAEVTIAFADGSASGSGGCNRYNAGFTVEGQSGIAFGPAASTMMACVGPGADVESLYLAMLEQVAGFEAAMGVLTFWDADQNIVANFSEVVPVPLVGTTWNAVSVNNGNNGVETVREGTSISAVFGEDGMLTGKACNNYSFGYTLDGDNITLLQGISTMMACENPDEMAQEAAYLQMLPQSATWSITGNALELRTADGALIASYVAE